MGGKSTSIAQQINLLALNASIEAARAGDTSYTVQEIKGTIVQIQGDFNDLSYNINYN